MQDITYRVIAHFQGEDRRPLQSGEYQVHLLDRDPISDDALGSCTLAPGGIATFEFSKADFRSIDSPLESRPDLYFVVTQGDRELLRTDLHPNVEFDKRHATAADPRVWQRAFGPFIVSNSQPY